MIPATVKMLFDRPPAIVQARPGETLSGEACIILGRLRLGPVSLGDAIDLSCYSGDLGRWVQELQAAGVPVRREADPDGRWVRYALAGGAADAEPGGSGGRMQGDDGDGGQVDRDK